MPQTTVDRVSDSHNPDGDPEQHCAIMPEVEVVRVTLVQEPLISGVWMCGRVNEAALSKSSGKANGTATGIPAWSTLEVWTTSGRPVVALPSRRNGHPYVARPLDQTLRIALPPPRQICTQSSCGYRTTSSYFPIRSTGPFNGFSPLLSRDGLILSCSTRKRPS